MTDKNNIKKIPVQPTCGIIMPMSAIDGCGTEHWANVLEILKDICTDAGFVPNLVSEADDVGVIHKRIIENIYSSDIVVCDVSCKNANVMFELGMRLAFDKPTVIIKDDLTGYSFDTSLIEHIDYPRDLRFNLILNFKETLKKRLIATHEKATNDPDYTTFLKNFGQYKIAHLENKVVTSDAFILKALEELKYEMRIIRYNSAQRIEPKSNSVLNIYSPTMGFSEGETQVLMRFISDYLAKHNVLKPDESTIQNIINEFENIPEVVRIVGSKQKLRRFVEYTMYVKFGAA
ncbi:RNA helicase [Chitinophaga sp. SYP-B3965]|uniref:RNA helicase n=1 Tax=Chitinophaga sp. SYP-B3965 TaxID=2663120 RepID=UPI001299C190|nr:RNA helicase [Chitinophaga sp. SYP-B3965]MRG46951.1 RNA helicase [Chitinophaga sp. SYP-B3965]